MDAKKLLDNLSSHLKNAIARAIAVAAAQQASAVSPGHLLLAVSEETGSIGADILKKLNMSGDTLRSMAARASMSGSSSTAVSAGGGVLPHLSDTSRQALEKAMLIAYERSHAYVGTEHLLYGLLHCNDRSVDECFSNAGIDHDMVDDQLDAIFVGTTRFPDVEDADEILDHMHSMLEGGRENGSLPMPLKTTDGKTADKQKMAKKQSTALDIFTVHLTGKDMDGKIDPVIGREKEIERVVHILARRTKNNPILVGEPGVGKTAIVEGLARNIAAGAVPGVLKRKKIYSLDLALLVAGTIYRGEFEARLRQIVDEVSRDPNAILFIDEVHNIIGAGNGSGAMDAANILKPALARGALRCIGATTFDEYQKHIKTDPALERRLLPVYVNEPSMEQTVDILRGVKNYYERFHHAAITDGAITAAARLAATFVHDNFLPDTAIDLLDEAAARVRTRSEPTAQERAVLAMEKQLEELTDKKNSAIGSESFDEAMALKKDIERLDAELAARQRLAAKTAVSRRKKVTESDVAAVLGARLSMDPALFLKNEWERLVELPDRLRRHVVGQDHVITALAERLRHAQLTAGRRRRPFAAFLFAGPSGVGKTKLGKALARELYYDEDALIRFDMSEFSESHSVSKILGSPAGYVGHNERNRFTDELRRRPYSVVLFDEFDKAHPDVRRLLLQILDEGELTDSQGKKTSFAHAIVILTTNVGADLYKSSGIGFGESGAPARMDAAVREKLKEEFGPALLGRLSRVFVFSPLAKEHIADIIRLSIAELNEHLRRSRGVSIRADESAIGSLADEQYNQDLGARTVEQAVEDVVHGLLSRRLGHENGAQKKSYRLTKTKKAYSLVGKRNAA